MREGGRAEGQSERTMDRSQTQRGQAQKDQGQKGQTIGQGKSDRDQAQRGQAQKDQTIGQGKADQLQRSERGRQDAQQQDRSRAGTQGQTTGAATQRQGTQAPQQQGTTGAATQSQTGAATQSQTSTTSQTQASHTTLNTQQQTTIRQSVFSARNAPRVNVNSINFAVNTGVVVPSHVRIASISAFPALIDVFPRFRDDSFFIVEDEIVILDRERRVVDVVPAGPRARFSRNFRGSGGGGSVAALNLSPAEIREVQLVLIERGLLRGEADGVLSTRTQQALISFQRQNGIQTSGRIDSRTVSSLGLSNKISAQSGQTSGGSQSSTVGQSQTGSQQNTTGQAGGQAQGGAQQTPAQQNTQGAPQNQSTVGQGGGNKPSANQNMKSEQGGQGNNPPPSTSGQGNAQPPAQNSGQKNSGRY